MYILPISGTNNYYANCSVNRFNQLNKKSPSFGWCTPHIKSMEELNNKFSYAVNNALKHIEANRVEINKKNLAKNTRYSLLDAAASKTAQLFSQYSNMQYTVAEMLPTYALRMNSSLISNIKKLYTVNDPIMTLITINDVTKMNMEAGIDKHTGKPYTQEQLLKAKSGTKLYTTVILLQQIEKTIDSIENKEVKNKVQNLYDMVQASLNNIYGDNTYARILALSNIEGEITNDQKRASVSLIKEFDSKAADLSLPPEFEQRLKELIDSENIRLGKTIMPDEQQYSTNLGIRVVYHTHPNEVSHSHEHHHEHPHFMTEEEHIAYHKHMHEIEQEQIKGKNGTNNAD